MELAETKNINTQLFFDLYDGVLAHAEFDPVDERIKRSYELIKDLDAPDIKNEDWKYTPIRKYLSLFDFQPHISEIPTCEPKFSSQNLVTIQNGHITSIELTKETAGKIEILPLIEGVGKYPELVEKYFYKTIHHSNDYFAHINQSFCLNGLFIYVHDHCIVDEPVYIQQDCYNENETFHQTHNLVLVGRDASMNLIKKELCTGDGGKVFHNLLTDAVILDHGKFSFNRLQNECKDTYQITHFYANLLPHATLNVNNITVGGAFARNNYWVELNGVESNAKLRGLSLLNEKQHADSWVKILHNSPYCESDQLFKSIVDDEATSVFSGRIYVAKHAQKTNAYQSNKNIVLTDTANSYSKPQLEIYADDVKCSHGSTSGQLNEDELFYLRARGIKEQEARKLLLYAFASNLVEQLDDEHFKNEVKGLIDTKFDNV
jgi:Fe-S cluster assembly protein SufD